MNYKGLQKLNEIIENLKAHPNSDENIQFVLDLADKSVQTETLKTLIQNGNSNYGIEIEKAVLEGKLPMERVEDAFSRVMKMKEKIPREFPELPHEPELQM